MIATLRRQLLRAVVALFVLSLVVNVLTLFSALYMLQIFDRVILTGSMATLNLLTVLVLAAICAQTLVEHSRQSILVRAGRWLERTTIGPALRRAVSARIAGEAYHHHALGDIRIVSGWVSGLGLVTVFDALWIPISLGVIALLHPLIALVASIGAVVMLVLNLVAVRVQRRQAQDLSQATMRDQDRRTQLIAQSDSVAANGMVPEMLTHYEAQRADLDQLGEQSSSAASVIASLTRWMRASLVIVTQAVSAWLIIDHQLSAGAFIAINMLMGKALAPIDGLCRLYAPAAQAWAAWGRLARHLGAAPALGATTLTAPSLEGPLTVQGLAWRPAADQPPLFQQVQLTIAAGDVVALVGPVGAGKSTLVRLLAGLAQPLSGSVRWNGYALNDLDSDHRGRHCGYLGQDPQLLHGSVAVNIARFRADATETDIVAAATLAGCHAFIQRLPKGYDTIVGAEGVPLSGGQRQLIALARAVYGRPGFVFLDEPNANLDQQGDHALLACLGALRAAGCRVLVVSHRPSVLRAATKVARLVGGRLSEMTPEAFAQESQDASRRFVKANEPALRLVSA